MYGEGFKMMGEALRTLAIVAAIAVPLAAWKLVEIIWWIVSHLRWE